MINTTLTPGVDWSVRARMQCEGFGTAQTFQGVKLDVVQADVQRVLENHCGAVRDLRINVFRSWLASDAVELAFIIKPSAPLATGDVSILSLGDPVFSPDKSLSYWLWYGANLSVYTGQAFNPYMENTGGIIPSGSLIVDEAKRGSEIFSTSGSTSTIGGLFRAMNTVRSTDPEQDGRLNVSVQAGDAIKNLTSWDVIPTWLNILLTALPIGIVVIGSVVLVRTITGFVKGT